MADFTMDELALESFKYLKELRKEYEEDILNRRVIDEAVDQKHYILLKKREEEELKKEIKKKGISKVRQETLSDEIKRLEKDDPDRLMKDLFATQELARRPLKTEKKLKMVEICIMKWKLPEIEKECVNRIIDKTTHPYKLTLYDNRPNSYKGCNTSKLWNKLIRESKCPYILIMDSDAFVQHEKWLEKFVTAFEDNPNAAVIGPVTGYNRSGVPRHQEDYHTDGDIEILNDHLSGFCFMISKESFKRIGPFDEDMYYFGQDSDWMNRVLESKGDILVHHGVQIVHGYPEHQKWSLSSTEARDKDGFSWKVDSMYASKMVTNNRKIRLVNPGKFTYRNSKLQLIKDLKKKNVQIRRSKK